MRRMSFGKDRTTKKRNRKRKKDVNTWKKWKSLKKTIRYANSSLMKKSKG